MYLRHNILKLAYPVLKTAGKIHVPLSHKKIKEAHVDLAKEILQPGDIFLSRSNSEFTNLIIWGSLKHLAIHTGDFKQVVEAVDPEVRYLGIYDFMMSKDVIVILRSKIATTKQKLLACDTAHSFVGRSYDYDFFIPDNIDRGQDVIKIVNKTLYCAEAGYWAYRKQWPNFPMDLRKVMGVWTVTPMDFYNSEYWEVIFDSRKVSV